MHNNMIVVQFKIEQDNQARSALIVAQMSGPLTV